MKIDKKIAEQLYFKKIEKEGNYKIELKKLFKMLNTSQIENLLEKNNISYLHEVGIDEDKLFDVIDKINNGEYYITCCIYDNDYYWDDYDYSYTDTFKIAPILQEAIEYVDLLFNEKKYDKAYKIGKSLIFLRVFFQNITEYDDVSYDSDIFAIADIFDKLSIKVNINKLRYQVLALTFLQKYDYEELSSLINELRLDYLKDFIESLIYVIDENECKNKLFKLLIDDNEKKKLRWQVIPKILSYLDDKKFFEEYVFENNFSDFLFNSFYNYLCKKEIDATEFVLKALPFLKEEEYLKKYYKIASYVKRDDFSIISELYKINPTDENFFSLFRLSEKYDISSLIKDDEFHKFLINLNKNKFTQLRLDQCILLLEIFKDRVNYQETDIYYKENVNYYVSKQKIDDDFLDKLIFTIDNKIFDQCEEYLGKERSLYYLLALDLYKLDSLTNFQFNFRSKYEKVFHAYRAFLKEIIKAYN